MVNDAWLMAEAASEASHSVMRHVPSITNPQQSGNQSIIDYQLNCLSIQVKASRSFSLAKSASVPNICRLGPLPLPLKSNDNRFRYLQKVRFLAGCLAAWLVGWLGGEYKPRRGIGTG